MLLQRARASWEQAEEGGLLIAGEGGSKSADGAVSKSLIRLSTLLHSVALRFNTLAHDAAAIHLEMAKLDLERAGGRARAFH
jgi:hypothetical protein